MTTQLSAIPKPTDPRDPRGYAVCQRSGCQQTHGLTVLFNNYPSESETKNLKCEKCGGLLTDERGHANLSRNPEIYTTITVEELDAQRKATLAEKRKALAKAQRELDAVENDEDAY